MALAIVKQEFSHPQKKSDRNAVPVNAVYKFPKYKDTVLSKLYVTLDGDRIIETQITEKPSGSTKQFDDLTDDVVAICNKDDDDRNRKELYRIDVGMVRPGQLVKVELHLVLPLEVVDASYYLQMPQSYLPQASDMNIFDLKISYHFKFSITSSQPITDVMYPKDYKVDERSTNSIYLEKSGSTLIFDLHGMERDPKTQMFVKYRTMYMDKPKMLYQRCPELKGYVALMAQFLPTFEQR